MPQASWSGLRLLLLTAPPDPVTEELVSASADAIILDCVGEPVPVAAVAAARPDLPIVVLADVDRARAEQMVTEGAETVLPRSGARIEDVLRAIRSAAPRPAPMAPTGERLARDSESLLARPMTDAPQLEAVGRLAGGVAHDYNNLLQVIGGNAEHLVANLAADSPLRGAADAIATAGRRATQLTQRLLAFGRQQRLVTTTSDLNAVVATAIPRLREQLGRHVRVETELGTGLPPVRVDRDQMVTVLTNLAINAYEAMPEGGTFTLTTDLCAISDDMRAHRPWLATGRFVRLQVADTGSGIEEQALPHLFEPFYTTKRAWRGGGLGLAAVYGVIKQSDGYIWVDSRVGEGTRITILFRPDSSDLAQAPDARVATPVTPPAIRLLVVEDDDGVRELLESMLEHHGFAVATAASAEDALAFEPHRDFDLLLTDVVLPGRSGPELARDLRTRAPDLPILFMSGHTGSVVGAGSDGEAEAFIQKPFTSAMLVARIREMLAGK
ncbi:MAG: response regulator [Acidobacteria bacterium]|nr:response regulator [Acidobacteriota bacterium]